MKKINILKALLLLVGFLSLHSCSEETYPETRLFRPVLNQDLLAINNTITVDMGKLKSAVYYKIEVSRDTFKTVLKTFDTPENKFVIQDLLWNTLYQVRATAFAEKAEFNSKISDFGGVKTEKFPSILLAATSADITDIAAKVRWLVVTGDKEVTTIKVFAAKDEELLTPLATYATTPAEIAAGIKIIPGLTPNTKYQLAIYSGTTVRGWDLYTTRPALTVVGTPIDLRNVPVTSTSLNDAFAAATNGQTIILDGDSTYKFNGNITLNKSVVLKSGYSLSTGGATVETNNQFEVGSGTYSVVFDGIKFKGLTGSAQTSYIVNGGTTSTATITDLKFLNCSMDNFRNLIRIRSNWGSGSLGTLTIDNCIVSTFGSAGMISTDNAVVTAPINNIVLTNSTFFNIQKLIYLRNSNVSSCAVKISDCTFYEAAKTAAMIEGTTAATIPSLQISNSIFGRGITSGAVVTPPVTVYDYALIKNVSAAPALVNNYNTNDFNFLAPIPSPVTLFAGDAQALWVDPVNGNFRIKATNFVGKSSAGDPRWRP